MWTHYWSGYRHQKRGAVTVLVAIAMSVLLGMVALSLDLGTLMVGAGRAQTVADAAALAGASGFVGGTDHSEALCQIGAIVQANNEAGALAADWKADEVTFYPAGATVPGYGQLTSAQTAVEVYVHVPIAYSFARALGVSGTVVTRSATALRETAGGQLACVFAHGLPSSPYHDVVYNGSGQVLYHSDLWSNADVTFNGSGQTITANAHADRDFTMNGSNQTITGRAEYVRNWTLNGSGHEVNPVQVPSNPRPYPLTYTADDFTYDYEIWGNYTVNGSYKVVPPGVYRVHGSVTVNGSRCSMANVTFVADGNITINGSAHGPATCAAPNFVLFLSLNGHVTVNGAQGEWRGTIMAPNGTVTFNGSDQCMKNGSLMGERVVINGSGWEIYGTPDPSGGTATVKLIR